MYFYKKINMKYLLLFTILFLLGFTVLQSQTVQTAYGPVTGQMNGAVYEFLGVPFATPPTDSLRWRPPLPPQTWTSPLAVQNFAPKCPQKASTQMDTTYTIEGDEDCLYLNVWTPDLSANLPVMVFIHGGGHQAGSASEITGGTYIYHGKNMAQRGDVVVVTIQYRLGALGFLAHPGLEAENPYGISGNYGIMDQILSLQWVQQNIAAFGGNPANVTIFGESAGGTLVGNMLINPHAAGLFHKAIIQSAAPNLMLYNEAITNGNNFIDQFTSTGTPQDKIVYMRQVHADSISKKLQSPLVGGVVQGNWLGVIDNHYFHAKPKTIFESGNFNKVPLIIGSNADEMSLSAPQTVTPAMVTALVNTSVPQVYRPMVLAEYPPGNNNAEARQSYVGILTDAQFTASTRRTAECVSLNQTEEVYRYFFTFNHTIAVLQPYGAYHGMELFYVFNTWENTNLGSGFLFKPEDDSVQTAMLAYWTQFARTGNPNVSGLPTWPVFASTTDCYLNIKATPDGAQCGIRTQKCDVWDMVVGFTGCSSSLSTPNLIQAADDVLIYPNPTENCFTISSSSDIVEIAVYDIFGRLVFHDNTANSSPKTYCMSSFYASAKAGIYFVRVIDDRASVVVKALIRQ